MIRIRLWWPGYSPVDILTSTSLENQDSRDFEVDGGNGWRLPQPGATISTIADWMLDNGKAVVGTHLLRSRRNGRWEGLYLLEIG